MNGSNTTERVREFLHYFYSDYGWFQSMTGISASKWRDLDRGKTKGVTAEMIDELCSVWPEYAYWFVTGNATSNRGQATPRGYLDLSYGTVRAFGGGGVRMWRESSGVLCPGRGNLLVEDQLSREWEISVAMIALHHSAFVSEDDALKLAPYFWEQFLKPIQPGNETSLSNRELKEWINQFPIKVDQSPEGRG